SQSGIRAPYVAYPKVYKSVRTRSRLEPFREFRFCAEVGPVTMLSRPRKRSTLRCLSPRPPAMSPALFLALALAPAQPSEPKVEKKDEKALPLGALKARLVGPAVTSGRIVGFAVHPKDRGHYFVAVASGGVWKTTNAGTTWTPVFDGEGSFSIGCV